MGKNPPKYGRTYVANVVGDSPEELEAEAMREAEEAFGYDADLELSRDYDFWRNDRRDWPATVKKYRGIVSVREVLSR